VIVDRLRAHENGGRVERAARVRWEGGEFDLTVTVPAEFAPATPDASPFLCATLLLAMRLAEDLDVRAPVAEPLLTSTHRIVDLYASWDPRLYRTRVAAEVAASGDMRAAGIGSFLSRGVDSLYSAAVPRGAPGAVTHAIFCDRLEPKHSAATRAEEIRLAQEAAGLLGLPLAVLDTNLRELSDPIVEDWEDMAGAALAMLANALGGGLAHVVVPSSDGPASIGPCGTSPLLDPLFSTDAVEVIHDTPQTRFAKVEWLVRERPELLPYLKVCFVEDRPDNCGRCSKCLVTMLALEALGALGSAVGFPDELDRDALSEMEPRGVNSRIDFEEVERGLRARGDRDELADAVAAALARGAAAAPVTISDRTPDFRRRASRHARLMLGHAAGPRSDAPLRQPLRSRPALPRTSVMMAAYNAGATVRESIASVLEQTVPDLELIVVDDGSREPLDGLVDEFGDPRLRVIRHARNRGLARARNTALRAARAALVSQLDADDLWEPDYLAEVLPRFEDQAIGLVYTNATILGHPTGHDDYIGDPSVHPLDSFPKLAEGCPVPAPSATMRTAAVRGVGGYGWWLSQCEDYHLYMRLARAGWRFDYVHRRLVRYRWPEPSRGMSYDTRRHELWELAMFGSMVARHPLTPGPRRQLRIRAGREAARLRGIAAARRRTRAATAPAQDARPRILVDPGSHAVLNLGDIAMLEVCVERLRRLVPGAAVSVVTADAERLTRHCPGVEPVPAEGVYEWLDSRWDGGPYASLLSAATRRRLDRAARLAARGGPDGARAALRAELLAREPVSDSVRAFLGALLDADAFVVSGRGGTADAFRDDGLRVLDELRLASDLGAVTAMVGQGLGPAEDAELLARAREVLPRLDLIAVRDRLGSPALLERAGVAGDRVVVTGDDALALAYAARPPALSAGGIGVCLRRAPYAELGPDTLDRVLDALRGAAERRATELHPVPISLYAHESDADVVTAAAASAAGPIEDVRGAIGQAGRCRVVVTGSYHAAVFALGQGVPVVGLAASAYYAAKFAGLADLFPGGCTVVDPTAHDAAHRIEAALDAEWDAAESARDGLLEAAARQVEAGEDAYARLAGAITGTPPGGSQNASNGSSSGSVSARSRLAIASN
jgi:polysaccharide pyruvyl transferase WcaK-like protein